MSLVWIVSVIIVQFACKSVNLFSMMKQAITHCHAPLDVRTLSFVKFIIFVFCLQRRLKLFFYVHINKNTFSKLVIDIENNNCSMIVINVLEQKNMF